MEIIIDSNRVIAALIKDSVARKIVLSSKFNFFMPAFGKTEVKKYWNYLLKKTKANDVQLNKVFEYLIENIEVVDTNEIKENNMRKAIEIMSHIDPKDVVFVAVALERGLDKIWSDDNDFKQQKHLKVLTTKKMVEILEK